jgi:hypothetical protein
LTRDFELALDLAFGFELLDKRAAPRFHSERQLIKASQAE